MSRSCKSVLISEALEGASGAFARRVARVAK